jgi:hypothetical protein
MLGPKIEANLSKVKTKTEQKLITLSGKPAKK